MTGTTTPPAIDATKEFEAVRSSLPGRVADVEPAHARRIADARLREVQAEWTEFEAAAKAPSHSLPSLQRFICGADLRLEELD
jgi:hypothetical protein